MNTSLHTFYEILYSFLEATGLDTIAASLKHEIEENNNDSNDWQSADHNEAVRHFVQMVTNWSLHNKDLHHASTDSKEVQTVDSYLTRTKRKEQWDDYNKKKLKKIDTNSEKIQIQTSKEEIQKRQMTFIEHKQEQNNVSNQREFFDSSKSEVCARTGIAQIERKNQIKVSRNQSTVGPTTAVKLHEGVEERLRNLEQHVNAVPAVPLDVYTRIKALEDKILELEKLTTIAKVTESAHTIEHSTPQRVPVSGKGRGKGLPKRITHPGKFCM